MRRALALALLLSLPASPARADMAHTARLVPLRAKASSSGKVLDKVPPDTDLAVLDRSPGGRGIKLLSGDKGGWRAGRDVQTPAAPVPPPEETAPTAPAGDTPAGAASAGGKGGGKGGAVRPEVWVEDSRYHAGGAPSAVTVTAARADLIDRPREGAAKVGEVKQGQHLSISRASRDTAFFLVELDGGRTAWIAAAAVAATKGEPVQTRPPPPDRSAAATETVPESAPTVEPAHEAAAR